QKMDLAGRMAGGIAHDFNNMMTVIKTLSDMGLTDVAQGSPLHEYFRNINMASARAILLTRKLSLFSRKNPVSLSQVNLNDTISASLKIISSLLGENTDISTTLTEKLWAVQADRNNMEQAVMNIVLNAKDSMPDGGSLTITTENIELKNKTFTQGIKPVTGNYICLTVTDTGAGMDSKTLDQIFEPFFTTKDIDQGTGLGLSVVYGIISNHMGGIDVFSSPREGTTVKLYLPAYDKAKLVKSRANASSTPGKPATSEEKILLVEDEELVSKATALALTRYGYNVVKARDAEEALMKFTQSKGEFKILVSDIVLPGRNGIELASQLSLLKPGLRVILISGYANFKNNSPEISKSGFKMLEKPYEIPDLISAITEDDS
ncbi:MAG: ATP-binding protein, partial [Thermodesulfobacteriota bacterium]